MTAWTRRSVLRSLSALSLAGVGLQHGPCWASVRPTLFEFGDLERFERLVAATRSPEQVVADYLASPSAGLSAYLRAYRLSPDSFRERLAERPRFYASIVGLRDRLRPFEAAAIAGMSRLRELLPGTPPSSVFFFVGTLGPGATVKEVRPGTDAASLGVLMPAELVAMTPQTDLSEFPEGRAGRAAVADLPGYVAHEYAHIAQVHRQGLARYRELYSVPGRATNLAMAVREGGADFLSWLATGQSRDRHLYFAAHEADLRQEFQAIAREPAARSRGWFSGMDERHPERPLQLGYALGRAMCQAFVDRATDRAAALDTIASAAMPADFEAVAAPYLGPGAG